MSEAAAGIRDDRASFWLFNDWLLVLFRVILAAVFIYAAVQKIGKPLAFAEEIKMYGILGDTPLLYIMAVALPWIELLCGVSMIAGPGLRGSALILLALNLMFLAAISIRTALIMRHDGTPFLRVFFDCGCGFGATYAWKKLAEDTLFFVFSLALLLAPRHRFVLRLSRRSS